MEALQLLQLRNVRQPAVMQEIEAELAAVTSDLVGAR
jgi:hypothetical protein